MGGKQCSLYDVFYSVQIKQRFLKFLVSPFNVIFLNFQFYEIVIKMLDDFQCFCGNCLPFNCVLRAILCSELYFSSELFCSLCTVNISFCGV